MKAVLLCNRIESGESDEVKLCLQRESLTGQARHKLFRIQLQSAIPNETCCLYLIRICERPPSRIFNQLPVNRFFRGPNEGLNPSRTPIDSTTSQLEINQAFYFPGPNSPYHRRKLAPCKLPANPCTPIIDTVFFETFAVRKRFHFAAEHSCNRSKSPHY